MSLLKWALVYLRLRRKISIKDKNTDSLSQIAEQIVKDMQKLRQGPVKNFIDRQLPHCIKEDKFFIPTEKMTNKAKLSNTLTFGFLDANVEQNLKRYNIDGCLSPFS